MTCGKERAWSDHVLGCSVPANRAGAEQQEPEMLKEEMLSPSSSIMASMKYKHLQKTLPFSRTWAWVMLKMSPRFPGLGKEGNRAADCPARPAISLCDSTTLLCALLTARLGYVNQRPKVFSKLNRPRGHQQSASSNRKQDKRGAREGRRHKSG